jgi:hypothetical protein
VQRCCYETLKIGEPKRYYFYVVLAVLELWVIFLDPQCRTDFLEGKVYGKTQATGVVNISLAYYSHVFLKIAPNGLRIKVVAQP